MRGPSHTPRKEAAVRVLTPEDLLARRRWVEERPLRKEEHCTAQEDATRAAKERARKTAQKQRKRAALLAAADEYETAPRADTTLADFLVD